MAKNCKNLNSISRYALLLMVVAGSNALTAAAPEQKPTVKTKYQETADLESASRAAMLNDIDELKKKVVEMVNSEKYPEAAEELNSLLVTLRGIPGSAAKQKLDEYVRFDKELRRKWAALVLQKSHDLFNEKKYEEAISLCSTINIIDKDNGPNITTPFIARCQDEIKAREYRDAIDMKKFDESVEKDIKEIDRQMRIAQTLYNNGKYMQVIPILEKIYLIDPFNIRATTLLDKTYGKLFRRAGERHGVTSLEMLAMTDWSWVSPYKDPLAERQIESPSIVKVAKNPVIARMEMIKFTRFDADGMDIKNILNILDESSKRYDKDGIGVTIIPQFTAAELKLPKFQKIHMHYSEMPLSDILRYLCMNLGIKYKVDNYGNVVIGTNIDDMVTAPVYFPVSDFVISDIIGGATSAPVAAAAADDIPVDNAPAGAAPAATAEAAGSTEAKLKDYFRARGIPFPAGSSIRYNRRLNRLEVINNEENIKLLGERLSQINRIADDIPMIMTEVKFVEVNEIDFNQLGFDWKFRLESEGRKNGLIGLTADANFITPEEETERPTAFIKDLNILPNFGSDWGGLKPTLSVTIHAMSQNDRVEVLTTPRLISKSGSVASINMVTETRYPDSWEAPEIESESDNITTISFPVPDLGEATPTGIMLTVTPTVNPDSTITLDLHPEIVTFLGSENSGYPVSVQQGVVDRQTGAMNPTMLNETYNIWMPELGVRRIDAKVKVQDGETIVLGGIINSTIERNEEKMPLLGSIPLFGRLFQNRSEESSKNNLLIFVTARKIRHDNGSPEQPFESNGTPHFNY